jgi:hypothetical protein
MMLGKASIVRPLPKDAEAETLSEAKLAVPVKVGFALGPVMA